MPPVKISKRRRYRLASLFTLIAFWPLINTWVIQDKNFEAGLYHQKKRMEPAAPWNLVVGYSKYRAQLAAMQENLKANLKIPPLQDFSEKQPDTPKTLVLVIGESTNRQRMSLYGYQRKTTPNLDKLRDDFIVFNDVVTPRPYTIEALEQALSFADQKDITAYYKKPTLLNIMKQSGYDITWITNQQTQTRRNTMLTTLSQLADHQIYLNNNRAQNSSQYDGAVITPFSEALSSRAPKKMIVIHLLGTHRGYKYRYPESFANFTTNKDAPRWINKNILAEYNSYDNAILYNDFVISELIKIFRKTSGQRLLLYFSDHGEEVYDYPDNLFCGRNEGKPSPAMYTIPFILWASPEYLAANDTALWKTYSNRPFSLSDFIYVWANIAGIDFSGMDYTRSLVSEQFVEHQRWVGNPYNQKSLRDYAEIPQMNIPLI